MTLASLKKEGTLAFLALFYFLIATNTQTGWLFVLSAFLIGLLAISLALSRRSIKNIDLEQRLLGEPQRDRPLRIRVELRNRSGKTVQEVRVESACPAWALGAGFGWTIPSLQGSAAVDYKLVPVRRGEHRLPPATVVCGAPFGLFTVTRTFTPEKSFLVYPPIERLPTARLRSRLALTMGESTSPRGKGDTHSLRAVRDYAPGDDLRHVHWKASAKRGAAMPLLVREHHAPAPSRVTLVLDSSGRGRERDDLFERSVVLAASLLWSAHREGTQTSLLCRLDEEWCYSSHWPSQYRALARVKWEPELAFQEWLESVEDGFEAAPRHAPRNSLGLVTSAAEVSHWPAWAGKIYRLEDDSDPACPHHAALLRLRGKAEGFEEVSRGV